MSLPPLTLKERFSFGLGDLGLSLPYNMASGFLLYYYINIVKLPAASVGVIFLIARLLDAVIDVLVGIAVDKTRSRWGRARGYILFMALPYALTFIAVFSVPDWGQNAQLIYAFLTFKALGILMSLGAIPFTALMPMMTDSQSEQLKLSGARSLGTSVSVVLGTAAVTPLVGLFGGGDERRGFMAVAILFGAVSLVSVTTLFRNSRERVEDTASPSFPILPAVGEMLRNRAWLVAFGFCFIYFIRFGGMMATTPYFAIDVLHKPWMISVMMPAVAGMLLLSSFVAPAFFARLGIRNGCVLALGSSAVLFMLLPFFENQPPLFLGIYIAACLATSVTITAAFTMGAATVDYHQQLFGTRKEGLLSAGVSLATKVGMAIGTAGIAFMLSAVAYAPATVSDSARDAIRWSYYGGTVVLLALQILVVMFWPMDARRGTRAERPAVA